MAAVSIIIPTNRTMAELVPCLTAIARQRFDLAQIEVIAVFNGLSTAARLAAADWPFRFIHDRLDESGICAAKNRALDHATGEWIVLINDDTMLDPNHLLSHLRAHQDLDGPAMVLGESVWKRYDDETVFDRMIAETSMVFFYNNMVPHQWYNFRYAWNLNLSVHRRYVETVRFDERLKPVNFDDLEWAYRMQHTFNLQVWYAPEARCLHDHRYTLDGYLRREVHLGRMAALLWHCNPGCYRAIFGSDLDDDYLDYCRKYVDIESRREDELRTLLNAAVARRPADLAQTASTQKDLVGLLYHTHLPLKRLAFRRGLLEASAQLESQHADSHFQRLAASAQRRRP